MAKFPAVWECFAIWMSFNSIDIAASNSSMKVDVQTGAIFSPALSLFFKLQHAESHVARAFWSQMRMVKCRWMYCLLTLSCHVFIRGPERTVKRLLGWHERYGFEFAVDVAWLGFKLFFFFGLFFFSLEVFVCFHFCNLIFFVLHCSMLFCCSAFLC